MAGLTLVYLIGPPAAGKSTLMAALTAGCQRHARTDPLAHDVLVDPHEGVALGAELGRRRARFAGTDALAMNVARRAEAFVAAAPYPLILAEGDRLAYAGFLSLAAAHYGVHLVHLDVPEEVTTTRCVARGSHQDGSWRRGRATKAARLFGNDTLPVHRVRLDGTRPAPDLVDALRTAVPALSTLPAPVVTG